MEGRRYTLIVIVMTIAVIYLLRIFGLQVVSQYYKGEEGIDTKLDSKNDIRYANQSKILNDLKYEINKLKFEKPATA
jgi:hypothetical protein